MLSKIENKIKELKIKPQDIELIFKVKKGWTCKVLKISDEALILKKWLEKIKINTNIPKDIVMWACKEFSVTPAGISGKSRCKELPQARRFIANALKLETPDIKLKEIQKKIGYRDHSTILFYFKTKYLIEKELKKYQNEI